MRERGIKCKAERLLYEPVFALNLARCTFLTAAFGSPFLCAGTKESAFNEPHFIRTSEDGQ